MRLVRFLVSGVLLLSPACIMSGDQLVNLFLNGVDRFGVDPGPRQYLPQSFVNWESPHVAPLALSADGTRLFAVNTPAARLEVFDVTDGGLSPMKAIPVGLDPVTVRVRGRDEAWVVNHISDSVSIVDVGRGIVTRALQTEDEPTDVALAGGQAFVVCAQRNLVQVFDLSDLTRPPQNLEIAGEHPRAAALSPDGRTLYVGIFESGNETTSLTRQMVSDPSGPYGGLNPPPNRPDGFYPPLAEGLPPPPEQSLIVRRDRATGRWRDEQGADWSQFVTWDLHGHDVAVIDTQTLAVSYVSRLMNLNMQLAVRADGALTVVGTEAFNEVRFEPNVTAKFVRSRLAIVQPSTSNSPAITELNPHLQAIYDSPTVTLPPEARAQSIADPRALVWSSDGSRGYVAGLGSNNVAVIDPAGARVATFDVGQGPSGLALDEARSRLYVLNRFDASISVVDTRTLAPVQTATMFDPTPDAIRIGRRFLYDARLTSGLGVTACASCHVDGRMDQLAWDLGVPSDPMKAFDQVCDDVSGGRFPQLPCGDYHPVKGPMVTQTLQGSVGQQPLHWRGDRADLTAFNHAFTSLNGSDRELTDAEMAAFQAYLSTITFPPNPNRNRDNSLKDDLEGGNPQRGQDLFLHQPIDTAQGLIHGSGVLVQLALQNAGPILSCNRCHQLPEGTNRRITKATLLDAPQSMKVAHLRNIYQKRGFDRGRLDNNRGFGFAHDGSFATLNDFFGLKLFDFGPGDAGVQRLRDVISFVLSMGTDTHAGVGMQVTLDALNSADASATGLADLMLQIADGGQVGLVVHGQLNGVPRGLAYLGGGTFQADGAGETWSVQQVRAAAAAGSPMTWTIVPLGSEDRLR
jgi:YVTN family beta-propeller protein